MYTPGANNHDEPVFTALKNKTFHIRQIKNTVLFFVFYTCLIGVIPGRQLHQLHKCFVSLQLFLGGSWRQLHKCFVCQRERLKQKELCAPRSDQILMPW